MIQQAIKTVVERHNLTREDAYQVMSCIMEGEATPAQIGAFMVAAKLKGETYQEVAGFAQAMREKADRVHTRFSNAIDMCGTGGDGAGTFNVSTVASFVAAGGGVPVAKHGNRSVSSKCGSADLLEALGVKIDLDAKQTGLCLDELGIAFLYAPALHKAMKYAVGPRREVAIRTFFNILGPLTNPALVRRQLLGTYDPALARLMAQVLNELGADHILIIHGDECLDEISIDGPTLVVELLGETITEKRLYPKDFGLTPNGKSQISGGLPEENAKLTLELLKGEKGSARDIVVANAACGFLVSGLAKTISVGVEMAKESIDTGAALKKLLALKQMSNDI